VRQRLALGACGLLLGCASASRDVIERRAGEVSAVVKQAEAKNAESCAPRELATAEANLHFAQLELGRGDAARAEEHLKAAAPAADEALAKSRECGKVTVVIHEKPPPTIVAEDTDGDGVPDVEDLCPEVKGPRERHGCPVVADRDKDGVADDVDRCPDEPGPAGNQGCPRQLTLIVVHRDRIELRQQIRFKPTRSVLLPESHEVLRQVAQALKDAPRVSVRIEGHTDNVGKRQGNIALSQARAEAVKQFLVKQGIEAGRLTALGYGPTRPIASNATRAGKTLNRRVEFRIAERRP
jgi:outer membrane protein OmpA-like peptidoglycan-associated protein